MKPIHWLLIAGAVAGGALLWSWGSGRSTAPPPGARLNYDNVSVSDGLTQQAEALNLEKDLDVALLPDIGRQVIREAAQKGLKEQAFLEYVVREVGNRVREISTIDLNGDGVVDPILVKPEPVQGEHYVLLSLRVPTQQAYPLPDAKDAAAWKKVDTFEVATLTVSLDKQALTVQAQPDQHLYPNQAGQTYAVQDTSPNFMQMYFAMRMVDWMFMPRYYGWWGPGYGYGFYRPIVVVHGGGLPPGRSYAAAPGSTTSAVRTSTGGAPVSQYGKTYSSQPPKALSELKSSTAFRKQAAAGSASSGGFGRPSTGSPSSRPQIESQRRSGSFQRSPSRAPRSGGFGRRR